MTIPKTWSKFDVEIVEEVVAFGFPAIEEYYDQLFGSVSDIEALNWPISGEVISLFLVHAREKIVPELKRRFALGLAAKDVNALYCYISRILYYWQRDVVILFRDELHDTIRLGAVYTEEHDAEALCLMLAHEIPLDSDIHLIGQDITKRHPEVVEHYKSTHRFLFSPEAHEKIVPELKRRFAVALATKDVGTLYVYIARTLNYWERDLVILFRDELHDMIRLGLIDTAGHDADALFLLLAHAIPLDPDVLTKVQDITKQNPEAAKRCYERLRRIHWVIHLGKRPCLGLRNPATW